MPLILGTNSIKDTGYTVANSVRLDGSSAYMNRTLGTATNRKKFTFSFWYKRELDGTHDTIAGWDSGGNLFEEIKIQSNQLKWTHRTSGGTSYTVQTNRLFLDPSAFYHIVIALDTTQGTDSNRVKIYVNGTQETSFATSNYPAQDLLSEINDSNDLNLFRWFPGSDYTGGYVSELVFIDGSALTPSSFGEFDDDSPQIWKPKDVSGLTFGDNGFYLDFADSGDLGDDESGNGNDFTENNLAAIDQSTDTPTNNAVTFMPNTPSASNFTLSQGNLKIDKSGSGTFGLYGSSIMLSNGKWYWEAKMTGDAGSDRTRVGLAAYESVTGTSSIQGSYSGFEFTSVTSGRFSITVDGSTTEVDGFNSYSTGDIIRFALDMDNTKLYVGINGDWFNYNSSDTGGDPTSGSGWVTNNATALAAPVTIYAGHAVGVSGSSELEFNFGATNTFSVSSGNSDGNGYGNFEYAVPSGYYAINSKNLAEYG